MREHAGFVYRGEFTLGIYERWFFPRLLEVSIRLPSYCHRRSHVGKPLSWKQECAPERAFDTATHVEPRKCPRSLTSDYRTSLLDNYQRKRHFHPSNRPSLPPPLLTLLRSVHSTRLTKPFHPKVPRLSMFHSRHDLLRATTTVPRLPKLLYQG
jgi:hypothetical protein